MKTSNGINHAEPKILALLNQSNADQVRKSAKIAQSYLNEGEVIATPTDTIYGLACLANNTKAVRQIYQIKGRDFAKPISICVAELQDLHKWSKVTVPEELLEQLLPGPVTLCFERLPCLNPELNPQSNLVGIRIPDYPFIREVCRLTNLPLALTSANVSNTQSALAIGEFSELYPKLSCIFDGGTLGLTETSRQGSTIVDLSKQGYYKIIRPGSAEISTTNKLKQFGLEHDC